MNRLQVLAFSLALAACHPAPEGASALRADDALSISYASLQQKSSHNSYERWEMPLDQLTYHRLRSMEFDLHHGHGGDDTKVAGDWHVYHYHGPFGETTACRLLSDCLGQLRAFHELVPAHEVVTVFLDLKDGWEAQRAPADLDALLAAHLGGALFRRSDLLARCPGEATPQGAIKACGWPSVGALQGRVLVALTGDDGPLNSYDGDAAFIAPGPGAMSNANAIFFNMDTGSVGHASAVHAAGFVSRVWGVNGEGDWNAARANAVNHIATDKVNFHADPWARTHNAYGYPFTCMDGHDCAEWRENGGALALTVDSKDIYGDEDNFSFLFASGGDGEWSGAVTGAQSHVERWAKGCLMARAGLARDAAYYAICRPADDSAPTIQRRMHDGDDTDEDAMEIGAGHVDHEVPALLRLVLTNDAHCAQGLASWDNVNWWSWDAVCFDARLTLQGFAGSSHGDPAVRWLYVAPRRDGAPQSTGTLQQANLGEVRSAAASDGF